MAYWFIKSTGSNGNTGKDNVGINTSSGTFDYTNVNAPTITKTAAFASYAPAAGDYLYLAISGASWTATFPVVSKTDSNTLVLGAYIFHTGTVASGTTTNTAQGAKVNLAQGSALMSDGDTLMVSDDIPDDTNNYNYNITINSTIQSTVAGVVRKIVNNSQNVSYFDDRGSSSVTKTITVSDINFDMTANGNNWGPIYITNVNNHCSFSFTNCIFGVTNAFYLIKFVAETSISRTLTFTGCTFNIIAGSNRGDFTLGSAANFTISNCTLSNVSTGEIQVGNITGNGTISGSTITGPQAISSIATVTGGFLNIDGNTISVASGDCITIPGYYDTVRIANNTLTSASTTVGSIFLGQEASGADDFNAHPIRYASVINNVLTSTAANHAFLAGLGVGSSGTDRAVTVTGGGEFAYNTVNCGSTNDAGVVFKTSGWDIHDNIIYSLNTSNSNGLALSGASNCHVHHNSCYFAGPQSLFITNNQALNPCSNNIITDNIFISAAAGTPINVTATATVTNNFLDRNIYWAVGGGFNIATLRATWVSGYANTIYALNDLNSLSVDPQVSSAATGNMRLNAGSPARGTRGATISLSTWSDKGSVAFLFPDGATNNPSLINCKHYHGQ